jgi:hypothetical protein
MILDVGRRERCAEPAALVPGRAHGPIHGGRGVARCPDARRAGQNAGHMRDTTARGPAPSRTTTKHLKKRAAGARMPTGAGICDRTLFLVLFGVIRAACGEVIFDHPHNGSSLSSARRDVLPAAGVCRRPRRGQGRCPAGGCASLDPGCVRRCWGGCGSSAGWGGAVR